MDPALTSLLAASLAFVGTHFAMSHPLRAPMVGLLGEKGFLGVYSLVSLACLVWMVLAFRAAPTGSGGLQGALGTASWIVASLLTLVALVLFLGSHRGNPAAPNTPLEKVAAAKVRGVFAVTRHPMMWSFALWALAHLLLHWSMRTTILAGAILVLGLLGSHFQDRKKELLMGDAWAGWEAKTSYWPRLGALFGVGPVLWLAALALWLAITWAHIPAAGVPAGIWRWV